MGKPVSVDFERGISGRALLRRPVAYNKFISETTFDLAD
jgi:hypothetical protein